MISSGRGRYFEDCNEALAVTRRTADYTGVAWYAVDQANAERLWDTALDLLPALTLPGTPASKAARSPTLRG